MPPPLTNSQRGDVGDRGDDLGAPRRDLLHRGALHGAHGDVLQAVARGVVADARDLSLVGHQPDKEHAVAAVDLEGKGLRLRGRPHRRALGPDLDPPTERPPAGVDVDRHPDRRRPLPGGGLDQVEVLGGVDHQHRRRLGLGLGEVGERANRLRVGRRVGADQVLEPLRCQPERLGGREGEEPAKAIAELEHPPHDRHRAHRLRRHPHRLARGHRHHVAGVGLERVEVDEREGRLEVSEGVS